ncbi:MAG TPA: nucleoside diphosphate kinase regulator [Armatimonadota bacterium]|nr:nucleoside diphosphate kinase regulator [Armatimonadota bacterium]HOJ21175.1 nucleoside diphosphate kinase regulator [Armatimonadota bacterium]HOM82653.1 nucleoside diphosphate kinase regulator [Armatimonadota bacterium]HPT97720.1 nucleoside diphosphate kinase regulator [Armatimonadota bacterium]
MSDKAGQRDIYVTEEDRARLLEMLRRDPPASEGLRTLAAELDRARVVTAAEVPPDVITMDSQVQLEDLDTGQEMVCTLVFPEDADASQGKISVLAPIGMAMLGYRVGDVFEWQVPSRKRRLLVKAVLYQPEASRVASR